MATRRSRTLARERRAFQRHGRGTLKRIGVLLAVIALISSVVIVVITYVEWPNVADYGAWLGQWV